MKRSMDYTILFTTLVLVLIGIVLVYDASYYTASQSKLYNYDGMFFFRKQVIGALVGTVAMLFASRFDYKKLAKLKGLVLLASLALLVLVLTPLGKSANGAARWINIPLFGSFQPSEAAKFSIILFLSSTMAIRKEQMKDFKRSVIPLLIIAGLQIGLVAIQPNMSMALCMIMLTGILLFIGGAKGSHLALLLLIAAVGVSGIVVYDKLTEGYRLKRYLAFIDPFEDVTGTGWQLVQSLYALGTGGLFGAGFGMGKQKYLWLPYAESDFIFAIYAEEFGWIGCVILLLIFAFLIWRGIRVALACEDLFGSLLAAGITTLIALQVLINVAVVSASIPPTGVPLPFISAGNSSLVIFMAQIGILLNISRQVRN